MDDLKDELYDMQPDKIALRKEIYRLQLNNENLLLENESLKEQLNLMQHENSSVSSDDDSFEQEYDGDGLDDRDHMQYENRLLCRKIDLQREKQDILLQNQNLVSANKRLTVKRSNSDLNRLLDDERVKNKLLERENSKLTTVQRHDTCEREASIQSKKASIAEGITQTVQEENIDLKKKVAGLRRDLIYLQTKYDRLHKKKTLIKKDNVTRPKEVTSPKLSGRSRSTRSKRSLTTTIENDSASNFCFDDRQQECDDCKHLHRQNEELKRILTEELDSERSAKSLLLKERNHYKGQVEQMKALQLDLEHCRALLKQENNNSEELRNSTEKNQQLEGQLSDLNTSGKELVEKNNYLNNEVKQLSNVLEGKDGEISKLKNKLLVKDKEIEERVNEIVLLKERHVENQELVSDLQTEINQYKSNLRAVNSSNLQREREKYQRELKTASTELENAVENNKLMDRMSSDLNKQMRELTMRKDSEINNLNYECQRKGKGIENAMTELFLIKEQNKTNKQLVTDLQIELGQYTRKLKEKDSDAANMSNTISILRREVETYQIELNQARDELRHVTENTDEKSEQAFIDERDSLNNKVRELTNKLKRKDSDVRKMGTKIDEFTSKEEKNIKLERQVTDLQIEVNQYKSDLNEKSIASTKLTNTISNLRREVETYQSELNQARDELGNATENNQQMDRQFSDIKKSNQAFIDETRSLKDKVRELTNVLKRKDSDVRKMETKMAECFSIEEKNSKLELQVTDLQVEVSQYKIELNDKSSASTKLTNTISNLRREVETYQSELNQARDELGNATENNQQMDRQFSDIKKSNQAFIDETRSLKDKVRELTNVLKRKDSNVRKMETKMAECFSIEEKNSKLELQVTDLQVEVSQYKIELNDKSSASTKLTNTIFNLRRKVETYQSELNQARDELGNATENNQQMDRQFSAIKKSNQAFIDETRSLKDKVRELTNVLKRKDSDVRKMETKMAECFSIEEKNSKLELQVTDLQVEVSQYKIELNDKSSASTKLTNTISNLRREVETYQSELNQARDELGNATENNQQMDRQFSDIKKSNQAFIDETRSLKDKVRELTNVLKRKDSDVRKMETKMAECFSIEEKNSKLELQVTDLQVEVSQYKIELNDKSSASTKLTNTISNLRREVETYQSELNQARDELGNATENNQQMDRQFSDIKKSNQAFIDETRSLKDKVRELTNVLKRNDSDVRKMETKMAECFSIEEKNSKLELQVTDLQVEVSQYKIELNDKSSASTKLTNTISNLRREVETYQSELNQARDELGNATENNQQMDRQFSDIKKSNQAFIDETRSLKDKVRELTNVLKRKDSDVRKMETKMAECFSIEEKNSKLELQVTDLQVEVSQYKIELNDKSSASTKLTNTISNLRREVETYQSELNQARDELGNATENNQQMDRQFSDIKKSNQAFIDETRSLKDKVRELTNVLKRKDSDVRKMETKMAECFSIEEKNSKLELQVTDLQVEVSQYKIELNDKSSAST
ncbi:putative leucine-rich repeat-containing protein DDB_G0290503 [Mya arenaria]|uniref:putative leucine-rich repeat-containing protein DDB_G0290503 n=1 Tax=Mya arenaria TaxID=6604 RepID=UPI0022E46A74|nr:putative leucine-rich repeat-containing protein DDB_G0290503 [Mya arenaria]